MTLKKEFEQLLFSKIKSQNTDLLKLRELLVDFKNRGMNEESMYKSLEEMRMYSDEETEDIILELMDFVSGFCNPALRIFQSEND